jgi:hypothetical protein
MLFLRPVDVSRLLTDDEGESITFVLLSRRPLETATFRTQ